MYVLDVRMYTGVKMVKGVQLPVVRVMFLNVAHDPGMCPLIGQ